MNRRMAALLERDPAIIAFVHGGDYAQHAQWRYLAPWPTDNELTIAQGGRIPPIVAVRGNHDHGALCIGLAMIPTNTINLARQET